MQDATTEQVSNHPPSPDIEVDEREVLPVPAPEETGEEEGDKDQHLEDALQDELETVRSLLTHLLDEVRGLREESSRIYEELERIRTDERMLQDVHEANKKLSEDFHEREILSPVFHTLIGIADRCYQQIALAKTEQTSLELAATERLSSLIESREADLIEIESRLADFGVQRYVSTKEEFDAKNHKCVQRRTTSDASLSGKIATRFLPGYRRNGKVIRPERVSVYVFATREAKKGEMPCQ